MGEDKKATEQQVQAKVPLKERVITWLKRQTFLAVLLVVAYGLWTWAFSMTNMAETIVSACALLLLLGVLLSLWRWGRGRKWAGKMFSFTRMVVVFAFFANLGAVGQIYWVKHREGLVELQMEASKEADREAMQQQARIEQANSIKRQHERCMSDPYCKKAMEIENEFFNVNKEGAYRSCISTIQTKTTGKFRWKSKNPDDIFPEFSVSVPDDTVTLNGKALEIRDEFDIWQKSAYRCIFNVRTLETTAHLKVME